MPVGRGPRVSGSRVPRASIHRLCGGLGSSHDAEKRGRGTTLSIPGGPWLSHSFRNQRNGPQHRVRIRYQDRGNRKSGNPLGGPGNEHNQRHMKCREGDHGDPKPHPPPELPPHRNSDGKRRNRVERRTCEGRLAKVVEQPEHGKCAQHDTQNPPPRQAHLLIFSGEDPTWWPVTIVVERSGRPRHVSHSWPIPAMPAGRGGRSRGALRSRCAGA